MFRRIRFIVIEKDTYILIVKAMIKNLYCYFDIKKYSVIPNNKSFGKRGGNFCVCQRERQGEEGRKEWYGNSR